MNRTFINLTTSLKEACRLTICLFFLAIASPQISYSQLVVTEAGTNAAGAALIEGVFLGSCVSVSNVSYLSNYNQAVGEFSNGSTTNIGLNGGILMTTGRSNLSIGTNNTKCAERQNGGPTDADLVAIAGASIRDRTVLEFDFIPQNDTLTFEYVFASEEYHEWVNAGYNDAFGFFISGPGIAGPYLNGAINIARIPGGATPVTIDNVNNGYKGPTSCATAAVASTGPCDNCAYFVDNTGGTTIQYDAFTRVLTATAVVTPCLTYHIKLAVGDAGDQKYDSGVFLKGGSFSAGGGVTVEIETTTIPPGIYEGCADAWFIFRRVDGSSNVSALTAGFTITGTATPGVDYTALPSSITIPAGQDSIVVPINVALDFITEGNESITVTLQDPPCACEAPGSATVNILDNDIPLSLTTTGTTTICLGQSTNLTANTSGSQTPYTGGWNNGAPAGNNVTVSPTNTTTYTYTLTDACGGQTVSRSETITVIRPDFTVNDASQCLDGNNFSFTNTGASGGSVTHLWNFGDSNTSNSENTSHTYTAAGNYTVTHSIIFTASACTASVTGIMVVFPEPLINATVTQNVTCAGGTNGAISTSVTGGTAGFTYLWTPGGQTTSSVSGRGVGTYSVTVTDANGCTDTDSETIIQNDPVLPTAVCQNITVQLNAGGTVTITAAQVNNGSTDNCGIASLSVSPNSFTCANMGTNAVVLTVTDVNGNVSTCNATVTVQDNIDPTAICQNITVQLNGAGTATITAAQVDNGSNDNCSVTLSATPLSFTCANTGANTVTLTATDPSGNTDQCTSTVTVQDNVDPTAICQNITVQLNGGGTATITAAQVNNGSSDNCSVVLSATPLTFNCSNTGANTVTLTATDPSGNTATCTSTVTVQDNVDPTAICQNITVQLNGAGTATITAAQVNNGSNDNCSVTLSATPLSFTCANTGANTVTLTATDPSGNTDQCTSTVTVQDNVDPTAICQNITVQLNGAGTATITAAQVDNGSNDNCSVTLSATPLSFTCANTGANTVTLTATDPSGNTATCTSTVTIQDNVDPTAICQNITVQLNGAGTATITAAQVNNGSNDNCSVTLSATPLSFTCANTGANTVTLTATDPSGNSATCTSTVTVQDNVDPTAICQNITVQLNGAGTATITAAQVDNGSNDNCSVTLSATPLSFTCANTGANTVTLTATDPSGNTDQCTSIVTVQDNVDPTAICQNITVQLNGAGTATITAAQVNNGSSDNCSVALTATPLSFTCANTGANTVTLTATDPSGNTDQCTSTVTIEDNVDPTAICQNITVQLDASGNASIVAAQVDNGSNDNCSVTLSATPLSFTCSNTGANTVTLTVTDPSGNTDQCTSTVTIEDNVDPTAICQNITVQLDASGNASIVAAQVDNGSNDNCSVTLSATPLSFTCANTGANTVTLTATDPSGNTDQCTSTVTIEDNVDPTAICQNITVQLDASGNASIVAAQVDNGSNDNCSVTLSATPLSFTCSNTGANTVTLTVTDPSGNTDQCTSTVTIEDNVDPTAICQNITVQLDASGNASIVAAQVDNGSNDNCSVTLSATPLSFTCANTGANTITLTVTDPSGNTDNCTSTVTIEDNVDPTAICQNITVQLDASGNASIVAAQVDNGSNDNCSVTLSATPLSFTCANTGANTVTLTVTDPSGNTDNCTSTVTIEDNVDPTAICQNITVQLDASGNASIVAAQVDNGSNDNCSVVLSATPLSFTCANTGANTVTLTATDPSGNTDQCTSTVTIEDNVDPTAICQNITVQLDASGNASIVAAQVDNGSNDNCSVVLSATPLSFTCANTGANTVTLTVTDPSGNTDNCTSTVTIEDNVDPTAICQDITVQLDASGNASIVAAQVDNGSNDNCSVTLSATPLSFTCANTGANTVTLTATDPSGNTDQCTSIVTVQDNVDPTAICQNITVQLNGAGTATITAAQVNNGSSDNCSVALTATPLSFTCANTGANTVTLTATDPSGNTDQCTSTVTVQDNVDPTAICQNITVQLNGAGTATITAAQVNNGSNDNCSVTLSATPLSFTCVNTGANTVTLTVTDPSGNTDNCTSTVTIEDNVDPTAICQDITVQLDASGNASIVAAQVDNGSNDNCSVTLSATPLSFTCSNTGANTVTLTVTDPSGNTDQCTSTVTIEDNVDPTAICQNITVQLDASGNASIVAAQVDNGSNDNCSVVLSATPLSFTCANTGANTITLTVTDPSGNTDNCTSTVTIEDNVDPTAICQNITVQLDASGNASIVAAQVDNGSNDNCSVVLSATPLSFTCANTGANTVTLTATDPSGNTDQCTSTVTIEDNVDPTAICQNITVQLDASGNASIVAAQVDNGSNDNCSVTLSATPLSFTCANTGANTVTLTVTDPSGNTDQCTSTVTIEDNVDPTAICQNITVQLDASGNASIVAAQVDNGSNDNCSVTLSATPLSFTCANTGANTVTLTVTDPSGNTDQCTSTVTIEDNVDPTAICQNITVQLDASGNASIVAAQVDNGSNDNCSVTLSATPLSFTCSNTGANTVTLTVTDPSGNTDQCTSTVTIEDNVDPTAICQNITVQLDASGNASIVAAQVDNGSNDNCSVTLSATPLSFTCANTGANTVTLTATDPSGNTDQCTSTVTIEDNVDPTAVCQNITVQLDASGNASIVAAQVDNGSNDNCSVVLSATPLSFTCANTGANTVTLTVTDPSGNTDNCTSTVTIEDNVDPTAVCQNITVQLDASGNASIVAAQVDNGSNDNCSVVLSATPLSFTCANTGANTVTLTVTDPSGNTDQCTSTVTIEDNVDPTAICQNITVQLDASGNASIVAAQVDNGSNDNCSVTLSATPLSFTCANTGANTVTLTVTDPSGNTDQCTSTVTIEDNVDPTAICQDITVQLDASGNASIVAAQVDNGSNDNCGVNSIIININTFDCSDIGNNLVVLTVTDVNGNTSTCTASVTIQDMVPPIPVCIDIIAELSPTGTVTVASGDVDNGSTDNCAIASITLNPNSFTCAEVGFNTVTLTVTDASGNVSTCNAQVDVQDNVLPNAVCQNLTVQLDASGNATITPNMVDNGSTDACGAVTPTIVTPSTFDCSNVGVNIVTLTVEDQNGNVSTCAATVTIQDIVPPIAVCQDITIQLDGTGNASILPADVDGGSSDNCSIDFMTVSPNAFTCAEEGPNTVTLTVTDVNGNVSTCTAVVTVENNIIPTVSCQDITVYLDGSGNVSIVAADVDGGSNAACGIASLTVNPSAFSCANVGLNTVTLTGTDNSGNVSTCTAVVTVLDTISPTAVCQNVVIQLNAAGNASVSAANVNNGSADNCSIASFTLSQTSFACAAVGANTVTLTVTDANGNTSTCTSSVTVEDNIDPTILCQNITVELDAAGNASITGADIDNGTSDNCSTVGSTLTLDVTPGAFDCNDVGVVTVTLTATDENGNSSSCTADVTVEDNEAPIALCQNISIYLDATGNVGIVPADVDNGSSDNCGIANIIVTPNSFTCSGVGSNPVTLTVTDVNGNVASCASTVTVLDIISPNAICQDIVVQVDASGNASIVPSQVNNGSNDACGITSLVVDVSTFNCSVVGANTVTLTVTDDNGNTSTCTSNVTVEDNVDPNALCQGITVQLDANGDASILASQIDNGSTDNCAVASLAVNPNTFNCSNVGANTVTLTVTDVNGNTRTCTATVTVQDNVAPNALCQNVTVQLNALGTGSVTAAAVNNGSNDNCAIATLAVSPNTFNCSNVGTNTVTLTVTDVNGNVSTCDATVTVEDNVDPTAICQNITVQLDANGDLTIVSADIDGGSTDNCGIASLTIDGGNTTQAFDCSNVGANTVTLTVTDVNGNVSTCDATVTIEDNVDPTAVCQNITVQLDANGDLTIVSADIDGGSTDNCGIASLTIDGGNTTQDFDCSNVGTNTVTLTVTDVNGNVSTCDATVTVEDNVDPTAICQNITVQLDANGDLTIVSADIDGGSTDNCGIASLTIDGGNTSQDFDCSNVGTNTVTLTVTDVNGNVSTCDATVTVEDNVDPTAICQNITVQLDANGDLTITSADIDGGSTDNCGIASLTIDGGNTTQDFDCSNVGTNTVTLTVTDVNGNVSTCDATVTVEDNVDPTAICQNITVQLDANGDLTIVSADIDGGSTDNCGIASLTIDGGNTTQAFDCSNVGANTVTLTVTDVNGNVSTCDATVTVEDNTDPTAVCQNITVQLDANGELTITSADIDGGSTDNCGIASLTIDGGNTTQAFDCSNVGANTVTLTVTDVNGNVSTCDATVTVEDNTDPTAVCQNITVQLDANGELTITSADIDGGSTDNCGIASLTIDGGNTTQDFDCSNVGTNTITLTVTDVNGNVSTCDATVTVEDNTDPTAVCQNITVQLDANGNLTITSADIDGGSTDNCGIASLEIDNGNTTQAFDCPNVGTNTVTLTVTDVNGNVSTCDATVTVEDNTDPTAVCQNITVQLDANGDLTITSADIDGGSTDNCGIASLEIDNGNTTQDFDCSNVGTNTVTLTVTDVNGNVSTCDATVTVEDNTDPTAICQNITVQLDANGDLTIVSADIDGGSTDNCGIASLEIDNGNTTQDFDCSNVGANTVTLTVTDVNGNVSTCDATVTVEDNTDPTAICQNITVQLDANGDLTITSADIDGGSTDNCGIASLEIDNGNTTQDFDCSNVGANTVTLTVTDVNGNVSTCDATVTVEDNTDPTAVCQNITVQLDANGDLTITSADIDGGSTDNCGIASLTIDGGNTTQDFDCSNVGTNTVTLTVTDVNGNVSTCDATVTVEDNVDPTAVCQNITVQLDANGELTITSADIDGGSTDNCGIASLTIDGGNTTQDFDCSNVGTNTITLTVTDVNGNVSTCDATVTVEDNTDPTAVCQNITVQLDATGNATISSIDIDGGSTDNCGIASFTVDGGNTTFDFDCADEGTNTITLTVTDVNGNVSACDATVTVENNVAPNVFCQDITVYLDGTGNISIIADDVNGGSNASCGLASLTVSQDAFDCSNVGVNTVTLTAVDNSGNVSTCDATVTVEDNVDPTAICQNITVQLDANGDLTIVSADIDGGSTDNCGIASLEIDNGNTTQDFDCSNVGANTVTLTVTDVNGNVSTCDATVTVEDNVDPTAICQNITVQLDANGDLTIVSADIDGGSTDNCGIASLTIDGGNTTQDFDCSNVGTNTVTLTVTDVNGNVSTCDATVTVEDTINPTIICQDITIELDPSGTVVLTAIELDGGTTDNCGSITLSIDATDTQWTCADVGTQTVTLTATDANGNVSTCDAQVTIENNVVPTVSCQNTTVYLNASGNVSIIADDVNGGSNASCGLASLTVSPNAFDCSNIGANTVTLTATDSTGNVTTCDAIVTVLDTISPTAVCNDITVDLDVNGDIIILAADLDGGSSDNCGVASVTVDSGQLNTTLDCSTVGDNIITVTVTDVNGNGSTCDATITVEDNTNPTAACASVTVQLDANGEAVITPVLVDNGSSDNCGIATMTVLPQMLNCNNIGANSVVLTVTDVNGNISTCIAAVTAQDTVPPTAICTDITVQLTTNGTAIIAAGDIDNGSFDNCGIQSLSIDVNSFDCSAIGGNTVELTVTDVNGNSSTCTANANVVDEVNPNVICQNLSVYLEANGQVTITADDIDNGSTDACGIDTMTLSVYTFDCTDIGVNPVTLTVTDNYGNFDICQAVVRVFDTIPPVTVCQDITIELDATGTASIVAADVDGGSTDNCGIDAISVSQTIFDCTQVGANTVTLTVVDVNGNESTCEAIVTVEDNILPNANCQDITVYLNANGDAFIEASDINIGSYANCGVDTVFVNPNTFNCSNVGNNSVTLTVVSNNGNTSTCAANVSVLDTISPTAICQDVLVQLNNGGNASTTANAINNGSFDNCAIASLTISQNTFNCTTAGVNTVILTVTDVNGNASTCTSEVTVEDNVSPNATCTPVVVQMDANGVATITADEVDLNSSDNCAIDTMLLSQYTFDCSEIGTNSVTLTVIDASGNSSTCTAVIVVEENVPPVALCHDMTVYLDANGDATILPSAVNAGSTDNCAIDTMYVTPNDFSCSGVGVNPVVLTVIDENGNVSSCNASVTVVDTISPVAICQDIVVQLNAAGEATIDAEEVDNASSDACGIIGFVVDLRNFDCSNVGGNTVVLTVQDNNGNTSTCTATVTIEDNINPVANCTDFTVILDGNGMVSILAEELNDNSTDNCAIDTIFASQIDFSCADLGSNIITVTVVDVNGNSDNCSSELTVLDTISPVIIACPMDTVIVPDSSNCSPQVFWTEPTATDNCTPTLTSNFAPGDNFPVGTTIVTYTATDESNNSVSCSFNVTIEPSPVLVEITSPQGPCGYNLGCSAVPNGEATANPSGGCLPYTYAWTNGQTTQTATGLSAGLHGVTVTDANGTSAVQTIILTAPDPLTTDSITSPVFAGGANISCIGEFDGAISINVLGGEECVTYTYSWTGPNGFTSTAEDISGLEAGTYIVVVSDASGCSYTDSITLTEPTPLDVDSLVSDYNGVNISCGGAADGSIDITISGGAAPYSVSWSNGDTTEDIDSLMAGIYTYTVTDANGCDISGFITLTEPDGLSSFITTSDYNGFQISCNGLADGSINLTVNEGTQPYSYSWNNGETTEDLANLEAGTYIANITDANGCALIDSVTLAQPDSLIVFSVDANLVSCNGALDGSFFVQANGGVPTYTFAWSDGQMGPTAEEIGSGFYTVTITDQNGCQDSLLLQMIEPDVLDASLVQIYDVICFGENNGIIDVNVIGGTTPYSYNWSNNDTLQDLNGVAAGTYFLEVTDANGCIDTLSATIAEPTELTMSIDTVIDATCSGAENGEITVEAIGGTAPYTYTWPTLNISGPTASGLHAGVYGVQVVDANGCSWSMNVAVGQPTTITAQVDVQSHVSCNGLANGSALITVSGGTTPYTYLWSNSNVDSLATGFGAGVHTVTVTDAGGCDTTLTFLIDEPALLTIALNTLLNVTCNGAANGQIEVDVIGGTIPYTATWSNGDAGLAAFDLAAGTYTVHVTDGSGCSDSLSTVLTEPDSINVFTVSTVNVLCKGGNNGEATILAQGGTAPLTINWPSIGQTGNTATSLEAGTYTFEVTDANGCTYTDTVQITQPDAIVVNITSDTAVCLGSGVTISASASGGAGNFSYTWNNGLGLGASHFVSPTVVTTYTVLVVDENGCAASLDSVTVNMASSPVAAFSSSASTPCVLPTDIQFTNMSSGATGYQWILGNGTQSSDVNPTATYANAGTYTVTLIAISSAGCADTTTGTVIIDNIPTAAFTLNNAQGCAPLVVNFGNNSTTGLDYFWDFGDGTTSTISNPIHVYDIPGDYEVTLIVSSLGGCSDTLSLGAAVSAYPSPIADFTANNTSFPDPGNEYEFVNNSVGGDLYNWDFGNDIQTDEFQPTYDFPSYGGYFVTLTAINEFGCADTAVHYISVELQTTLYVPNAMGIGEVGEASIFLPKGTGIADYHLWIFDNWGNLLWESTALNNGSPAEGWDGIYKGSYVPQGSYVWKINATFVDGEIWDGQDFTNGKHGNSGTVMVLY